MGVLAFFLLHKSYHKLGAVRIVKHFSSIKLFLVFLYSIFAYIFCAMDLKKVVLIVACVVVFIVLAASCGGVGWTKLEQTFSAGPFSGKVEVKSGLWRTCNGDVCGSISGSSSKLDAVRAFSVLAILLSIAATALAILFMFTDKVKGMFVAIALIAAGACMLIAMAIFTADVEDAVMKPDYGWAYALGWVGTIGSFAAAVIGFL